jgi:uncharacterized protein DUF3124
MQGHADSNNVADFRCGYTRRGASDGCSGFHLVCTHFGIIARLQRHEREAMTKTRIAAAGFLWLASLFGHPISTSAQTPRSIEQTFAASLTEMPKQTLSVTGSIYVPAYSSVSLVPDQLRADFSVTLSIHNASQDKPLVLKRVAYFSTTGQLVQSYLQQPIALRPFATVEIFISQNDVRGGTGANFIVDWAAVGEVAEPVAEALMFGSIGGGSYAFISQGRSIRMIGSN